MYAQTDVDTKSSANSNFSMVPRIITEPFSGIGKHAVQGSLCFGVALSQSVSLPQWLGTLFLQVELGCGELEELRAMSDDSVVCQHDRFAPA